MQQAHKSGQFCGSPVELLVGPSVGLVVANSSAGNSPNAGPSSCGAALADELWEIGNRAAGSGEARAEIIPKGDAVLVAGLDQRQEGIAAVASDVAAGSAADLALGDEGTDVVFGAVGMERDLRAIEHHQQFSLVGVQAGKQPIEAGKAGAAPEDAVEAGPQGGLAFRTGMAAIGLEIVVEAPDQTA